MSLVTNELKSYQRGCVTIEGSFLPNGTSAVVNASNTGTGFTVAYGGSAGTWTITLTDVYQQIISVNPTLALSTPAAQFMQLGAISAANRTIVLNVVDASGALSGVASNAANRIHFTVVAKWSNV